MKKVSSTRVLRKDDRQLLGSMLALSITCHLVLGLFLTLVPRLGPAPPPVVPYVTVNLASMPLPPAKAATASLPGGPALAPPARKQVEPEPVEETEPVKEEPVKESPAPKVEPKAETKPTPKAETKPETKPAEKPGEKLGEKKQEERKPEAKPAETAPPEEDYEAGKKSALAALKQRVEAKERSDAIKRAISGIRKKVAEEGGVSVGSGGPAGATPNLPGGEGLSDAVAIPKVMMIYALDLVKHINAHWAYESSLAGKNRKLLAEVVLTIGRNGTISDYFFTQRSGNAYFDDSVDKAIKKSNPAPSLPPTYTGDRFQFGITFIPPE